MTIREYERRILERERIIIKVDGNPDDEIVKPYCHRYPCKHYETIKSFERQCVKPFLGNRTYKICGRDGKPLKRTPYSIGIIQLSTKLLEEQLAKLGDDVQ